VQRLAVFVVVALLAFAGCKKAREWAEQKVEERQDAREAEGEAERVADERAAALAPKPTGPGIAPGEYRLVEVRVEAAAMNRKNRPWDDAPGESPDLVVTITVDGVQRETCKPTANTHVGKCVLDLPLVLDRTSSIAIEVVDRDTILDDAIGKATLTDPATWGVNTPLPMTPSTRLLKSAAIVLTRTPTWWELHRGRLVGLGAGVLLALGVVGTFRRSLMPPPPVPVPPPACAHCGALLGASRETCSHCGAVQKGAHA